MEKKVIEERAENLLQEYKDYINDKCFVDIIGMAKEMGFSVVQGDLDDSEDGFIIVDNSKDELLGIKTNKLIAVNQSRDYNLKRFIIAHELAHYYLSDNKEILAHRENKIGKSEQENDMDYFAACLLMPKKRFISLFEKCKNEFKGEILPLIMAKECGVTIKTVSRRFEELDLVF